MKAQRVQLFFLLSSYTLILNACFASNSNGNEPQDVKRSQFPDGFLFGTSTSSYQVEGAYLEDGKGLNNWDVFSHTAGKIKNNDNGDVADNHYHQFLWFVFPYTGRVFNFSTQEDIDLMQSLGVNAYRFSISWTRILPRGRFGEVNPRGLEFYNKLINNLLIRGIEPFATLQHFDIPQELEDRYNGWLSPLIQEDFVYYAEICFKSFGDRIKYWATINEPNLNADFGYIKGRYPPGRCSPPFGNCSTGDSDVEPLIVVHNMILAHAKAVKLFREHFQSKQGGSIGIVVYMIMFEEFTDSAADREAARRALAFDVAWPLDPIVLGEYPPEMRHYLGRTLPSFSKEEINYVKGSTDFIGINHYSTLYAKDCINSTCDTPSDRPILGFVYRTGYRDGVPIGEPGAHPRFFVVPRGMENIVNYIKERYNNMPMFVTENGYSAPPQEKENVDELLQDTKQINYLETYLASLATAIRNGANVRGYFVWSLMDNFEWSEGYTLHFGLYYVDRQTLKRVPKLSAKWYRNFLRNGSHQGQVLSSASF